MNKIFALETTSIRSVMDHLESIEARSMIWMRLTKSGDRAKAIMAAEAVLSLIQDRTAPTGPLMEGSLLLSRVTDRRGRERYRGFGLVFSAGRSWHEPFDAIAELEADAMYCGWEAHIGIEEERVFVQIDSYLDPLRQLHFESTHGPHKLYRQTKTIEIFPFIGTSVELGNLGVVAAMFGASPLNSGARAISAI